tara:strand:+ start:3470 stop:4558 length:1089 start_codon:yes stop_codon:yes gene_type:complete
MAATVQIVLLFAITLLMLLLTLVPALLEWYAKTDAEPLRVVREQDTSIRHFATSFRTQVNTFFDDHGIELEDPPSPFNAVWHIDEPVSFLGATPAPDFSPDEIKARRINRVLIGTSSMFLPGDMVYEEEVYCCGDLTTGDRTAYRALYAEREISLGDESVVVRWLHAGGAVTVGPGSRLFGRLSADQSVTLGAECEFERISSPVIRFAPDNVSPRHLDARVTLESWNPEPPLQSIDCDTLKAHAALTIPDHVRVDKHVIAKRALSYGAGVEVVGDTKAGKSLRIGRGAVIRGSLVCSGLIEIEADCLIKGPVISELGISIGTGCVIGTPAKPTTVSAPQIAVASGTQVSGTVWAGASGQVGT